MALARPWVNMVNTNASTAPFLSEAAVRYSAQLFSQPIVKHPITGVFNVEKQSLGRVPAVAMLGESNAGKSTLLNKLLNLKQESTGHVKLSAAQIGFSPVSARPGRTRHVFRFDLSNKLRICDLPGYGYAQAPQHITESWNGLIDSFLDRADLRRAIVLVDASKGLSELDLAVMETLQLREIPIQVVLTKIDLIQPGMLSRLMQNTVDTLLCPPFNRKFIFPYIHAVSAVKDYGMLELRCTLGALARNAHFS